ncbi:MAG: putative lipid II flippase FtsW [Epsilonproteobacteria bacterium]|nr:putative lipid II flippase FtsW [Campylobacterota bacterium]
MNKSSLKSHLLISSSILVIIGIIAIYSSSTPIGISKYHDGAHFLKIYLAHLPVGIILFWYYAHLPSEKLMRQSRLYILVAAVLLLLVFPPLGHKINGSYRWLKIMSLSFQPSELAKFAIILYSSYYISKHRDIKRYSIILPIIILLLMIAVLVVIEPDFGNAVVILLIGFLMLIAADAKIVHIFITGGLLAASAAFVMISSPYRLNRIAAYLHPWENSRTIGYQAVQSIVAIGSGGLTGKGLGNSDARLFFLPDAYNDYIFSIISEETGFLGSTVVIAIFVYFLIICTKILLRASDKFDRMTAFGITTLFASESVFNMMVVTGLLPPKGIVLPFISYGGTAMLINFMMLGILYRIAEK